MKGSLAIIIGIVVVVVILAVYLMSTGRHALPSTSTLPAYTTNVTTISNTSAANTPSPVSGQFANVTGANSTSPGPSVFTNGTDANVSQDQSYNGLLSNSNVTPAP